MLTKRMGTGIADPLSKLTEYMEGNHTGGKVTEQCGTTTVIGELDLRKMLARVNRCFEALLVLHRALTQI